MSRTLFTIFFLVLVQSGCSDGLTAQKPQLSLEQQPSPKHAGDIGIDRAIGIATQESLKKLSSLETYNTVTCDDDRSWLVFFEPKNPDSQEKLLEYAIRKRGGLVLGFDELPMQVIGVGAEAKASPRKEQVGREEAISIAETDSARRNESLKGERRTVCELNFVWRIVYHPPEGWAGGGPHYLIEKKTGRILDRKNYQ